MTRARFGSRCVRLLLGSTCNVMECMSVPQGRHRDRGISVDEAFSADGAVQISNKIMELRDTPQQRHNCAHRIYITPPPVIVPVKLLSLRTLAAS